MEKKELKMYDAPIVEVVELEAKIALLAGSGGDGGQDIEPPIEF